MKFDVKTLCEKFRSGLNELKKDYNFSFGDGAIITAGIGEAGVAKVKGGFHITYDKDSEFYRGFVKLLNGTYGYNERCSFSNMGVMLDCSRNAVLTVEAVKKYIRFMACAGYNTLMLYTEDTYEVDGEPYFGYMRGRYSKAELTEIDGYAQMFGIELVPCIQTLAHMNAITRWDRFGPIIDCNDILLADDGRTYELIEKMFKTLSECFTSHRVHIGMDEAHMVGLGRYLDVNGYCNRFEILIKHLDCVLDIAKKYGFSCSMWSDMFFKLVNCGEYYVNGENEEKMSTATDLIPRDLTLIYWDYYSNEQARYEKMLAVHKKLGKSIAFAGGAWRWNSFTPANSMSVSRTALALNACRNYGVDELLMTVWGDNGCECSAFSVLPALVYAAENAYGNSDYRSAFKNITGIDYNDFNALELADDFIKDKSEFYGSNFSKVLLYNDLLCGVYDFAVKPEYKEILQENARKIKAAARRCKKYSFLFKTVAALAELNARKCDFGLRARDAYRKNDGEELKSLADEIVVLVKLTDNFYRALKAQWNDENKPFGFEVQDARIGGLKQRMFHCREILYDYVCGKSTSIPELEQEILSAYVYDERGEFRSNQGWGEFVTCGSL